MSEYYRLTRPDQLHRDLLHPILEVVGDSIREITDLAQVVREENRDNLQKFVAIYRIIFRGDTIPSISGLPSTVIGIDRSGQLEFVENNSHFIMERLSHESTLSSRHVAQSYLNGGGDL